MADEKAVKKAAKTKAGEKKAEEKPEAPKVEEKKPEKQKPEKPKAETRAEAKKESDPGREFVDGIMTEMNLKGASKKRLIKKLAEQYSFDKQKVLFKLKRALITERYAAAVDAGGH